MRVNLLLTGRIIGLALGALGLGGVIVASCTFNPGPAGSGATGTSTGTATGQSTGNPFGGSSGSHTGAGGGTGSYTGPCKGLQCRQNNCTMGSCVAQPCAAGAKTTVSGTVYDPAGKVPLYNVIVYVPNAPLAPITEGASCERCGAVSGSPVTTALTDEAGRFVLQNVPIGDSVPLVIQVGKWRRELTIPSVTSCADTALADKNLTRLPRNQSEGHIPKIALTTGNADALECLLRKIGLEDAEFTPESGAGRVNLFAGQGGTNSYQSTLNAGAALPSVVPWWDSPANLLKYDILLHSCEGTENPSNKSMMARQAFLQYAAAGGRAFLSHWHNYWLEDGPAPLPSVATFDHQDDLPNPITALIDTSFPKGQAMASWLLNVGGSTTRGQLEIRAGQHTVNAATNMTSQRWIYLDGMPAAQEETLRNPSVQYFTFNTPVNVPVAQQCGRVVMSDIHVSNAGTPNDSSSPDLPFPSGCLATDLSPQEKALEFMLFDLSSCVQDDKLPPVIP